MVSITTRFQCPSCGRSFRGPVRVLPFFCSCGARLDEITYSSVGDYAAPVVQRKPQELPCIHRGQSIREINCGCQGKHYIYACDKHGECYLRKLPKFPREETEGRQMCLDCDDRSQFIKGTLGVLSTVFNDIGGTETYWAMLHREIGISGLVTPQAPKRTHAPFTVGWGEDSIGNLCDSVENLIVWGVTGLGKQTEGPRRIAMHHGSLDSAWANKIFEDQLTWCETAVAINRDVSQKYGCHYLPNAVDSSRITGTPYPKEKKVALWLHRDSHEKRPWLARRIAEALPDDWVLVASLPQERQSVRLHCVGQVDHPGNWLATADVFISTASQEGFGYSIAEAMAAGVPVVSSPFGIAIDTTLVEQVTSEDPEDWIDAILRAGAKVDRARAYIHEHHSAEAWAEAWRNLLKP